MIEDGQKLLLERFLLNPNQILTWNTVRHTCITIRNQLSVNSDLLRENYLNPLIAVGILDFRGNDNYSLSPSAILQINKEYFAINIPYAKVRKLDNKTELLHKTIFKIDKNSGKNLSKEMNIPVSSISCEYLCSIIPSINNIIDNFKEVAIYETGTFNYFDNGWKNPENCNLLGIYRASEDIYSNRYIRISEKKWLEIPNIKNNIDAFHLSHIYSLILQNKSIGVHYNRKSETLIVRNFLFPLILMRLLYLNSSFDKAKIQIINHRTVFRDVKHTFYRTLDKFFMHKIELDEKSI